MDMGTTTSMSMPMPSSTSSADMSMTTDNTPGQYNSKGQYVPTDDEMMAYQAARIPWDAEVKYGYYTLSVLCGILAIYTMLNVLWKLKIRYSHNRTTRKNEIWDKIIALARISTYPRLPQNKFMSWLWTFGSLGPNLLLGFGILFSTFLTFINEYYYYPPFYGSGPLFLRSEWIAMACLPFVFVLGSKRNIISILTGISHEKLQVVHQGLAFNFTYMSLVHTISACIRAISERGIKGTLATNSAFLSGFVALAPLLVLFVGALPPFRKSFYESFYWIHITMAVFFLGAMFWHGYQLLDSDSYMITTIVLFLFSATWRTLMIIFNNPILHQAQAEMIDSETLKLTIPTLYINWKPGQHVFLRFLGIRPIDSHPFSLSTITPPEKRNDQFKNMVFLLKPSGGFTKILFDKVKNGQDKFKVLIDGPYGGVKNNELRGFDNVLILAGGTGITWSLGILQDLTWYGEAGQDVVLVWAVRRISSMTWFEKELETIKTQFPHVQIRIHITRESTEDIKTITHSGSPSLNEQSSSSHETPTTEKELNLTSNKSLQTYQGRPDLPVIIQDVVSTTQGSLAVATCGPEQFLTDCANSVTKAQIGILTGRYQDLTEVYLKSESYGW